MSYAKDLMNEPDSPPDSHPLAGDASQLRMGVFRFARRMRTERSIDSMSDGQFAVLADLYLNGPRTLGELAERERVSPPSMNRTVNCLQDTGYVERSADDNDGRKVVITITDDGRAVVDETTRRRDAWVETVLADITEQERATLTAAAAVLQRLAAQ
ncbi:MarR family transcriptional regulator [Microbacterium schleiferi]|uniref:MarR family transcriptional regulator n=2 Tax=Microbacterium schleiferi TaxID=69362 RepID=A0A7S8MW03_9MICO|nr:MarR family transcriptional regulator [Microbacterium schleiferi]